jgi:hypothetical protein
VLTGCPGALESDNMEVFWDALRINSDMNEEVVEKRGSAITTWLPMRRVQPVHDRTGQLNSALTSVMTVRCTNIAARCHYPRVSIGGFHDGDMLLCRGALDDGFALHVLVHPIEPSSEDCSTLSIHTGTLTITTACHALTIPNCGL